MPETSFYCLRDKKSYSLEVESVRKTKRGHLAVSTCPNGHDVYRIISKKQYEDWR